MRRGGPHCDDVGDGQSRHILIMGDVSPCRKGKAFDTQYARPHYSNMYLISDIVYTDWLSRAAYAINIRSSGRPSTYTLLKLLKLFVLNECNCG